MEKTLNILKQLWTNAGRVAIDGSETYHDSILTGIVKDIEWYLPNDVYTSGKVYFKIKLEDVHIFKKEDYPGSSNYTSIQSLTDTFELNNFAIKRV